MIRKTFASALVYATIVNAAGKWSRALDWWSGTDFKGDDYIALTRQEKSDKMWNKVTEDSESGEWHFAETLFIGQNEVFDTKGDEFDCGYFMCRHKTIHSVGNVGQI